MEGPSNVTMELQSLVNSCGGRKTYHTVEPFRRTIPYRVFAVVYVCTAAALFYRHIQTLISHSKTPLSLFISISLLISDIVLAFMWATAQAFRLKPIRRKEFPEELRRVLKDESFPAIDVFICTADPYKEPPGSVVNTALSLMAYEYPAEKLSVYVSDDGGSALTLFAFMEAAKFGRHWLPFCRENKVIMERSPDEFFSSSHVHASFAGSSQTYSNIKMMYKEMKDKIEGVMLKGKIDEEDMITKSTPEREAFRIWDSNFTRQDHPAVIQILLNKSEDKDISGHPMPNLIYVSREKRKGSPHHFKAGALNVLVRVSGVISNAPIILTQDCDMYSNDPETPLRVLCYLSDPSLQSKLGYIQFPQRFHGVCKDDIYANEYKRLFIINPMGMDGTMGPNYVGSGCFFLRRALFGGPSSMVHPELPQLRPDHVVAEPIRSELILALAHQVAASNYENNTGWGSKMGMKYGSLVEDFYTGYRLKCEGWKALFCNPDRAAFWGDIPITLLDNVNQCKRWCIGLLEVTFSRYSPLTYGAKSTHILLALGYAHYSHWPFYSIPITTYAFLPQLSLLNSVPIFPKISEKWFILYMFLFLGAYGQDLLDFVLSGGTLRRWWSDQRMWSIRGLTCFSFGAAEFLFKSLGISTHGFSLTSKVLDDKQSKRYEQGVFEFGVVSPMFVLLTTAALINLLSLVWGAGRAIISTGQDMEGLWLQMLLAGFIVINSIPVYDAIVVRRDAGRIPNKTIGTAVFLVGLLCAGSSMIF